jgi:hypothetical protein
MPFASWNKQQPRTWDPSPVIRLAHLSKKNVYQPRKRFSLPLQWPKEEKKKKTVLAVSTARG